MVNLQSAKHYLKDLFWAGNHTKYQELEVYDCIQKRLQNKDVKDFVM